MRRAIVLLSMGVLCLACGREAQSADQAGAEHEQAAQAPAAAPAQAPPPSAALAPRLGGALVVTGDYAVEVIPHAEGTVEAAVTTVAGQSVASDEVSALEVTVQGQAKARHTVALEWDAPRAVFRGAVEGSARLLPGPLELSYSIGGKLHEGRIELAAVLPKPRFGGRMMLVGEYSAEVVPKLGGEFEVHMHDAAGAALKGAGALALKLQASGKAGALHAVALRWNGTCACFAGKLEAGAELAAGPIVLTARAAELEASGRVEATARVAPPSLDGNVIAAGDFSVEVAPRVDGQIEAIVRNAAGATVEGSARLDLRVRAGGELRPVTLAWDPALGRFHGRLDGDFKLEPGPIEVSLAFDGRLHEGAILAAAVLPAIDVDADARLAANAKGKLKAKAAAAHQARAGVKAGLKPAQASASAKLNVKVPQPSVKVKAGTSADAKASGSAQARTAGSTKQTAGAKAGGSLSAGFKLGN